jgi:hypothetical protein
MAEPAQPISTSTQLVCEECRRGWWTSSERWRVYLSDDTPPVPVAYCPECAHLEFD